MQIKEIVSILNDWSPPGVAWDKDNPGVQVGVLPNDVMNVLISLDISQATVDEALRNKCNLIITHHPLFFHSIKQIHPTSDPASAVLYSLIKNDITVISYHTNLDFTKDGINYQLASALGLKNVRFLKNLDSNQVKLVTFVPEQNVDQVAESLYEIGCGIIGDYSRCSFRLKGEGTFFGSNETSPAVGKRLEYERTPEIRLEILAPKWKLEQAKSVLKNAHPYEEPAYDIYPLLNENVNFGMGAIGELAEPMNSADFLTFISQKLKLDGLRYSGRMDKMIATAAVCGGSGSELIRQAFDAGADVFITGDITYHRFLEAPSDLLIIDAGHFETEVIGLKEIQNRIQNYFQKAGIPNRVFISATQGGIIKFFTNKGE